MTTLLDPTPAPDARPTFDALAAGDATDPCCSWCDDDKPCAYHRGFADGWNSARETVLELDDDQVDQ